jgi:hypothetical protein
MKPTLKYHKKRRPIISIDDSPWAGAFLIFLITSWLFVIYLVGGLVRPG